MLYHIPKIWRERENTIFYWNELDLGLFYTRTCELQVLNKAWSKYSRSDTCPLEFKLKCTYLAFFAPCFQLVCHTTSISQLGLLSANLSTPLLPPYFHHLRNEKTFLILIHAIANAGTTRINQLSFSHNVACVHSYQLSWLHAAALLQHSLCENRFWNSFLSASWNW